MPTEPNPQDAILNVSSEPPGFDAVVSEGGDSSGEIEILVSAASEAAIELFVAADVCEETDVWWGSYAGRTMTPTFAVCAILSIVIALIFAWIWNEDRTQLLWHLAMLLIVAVWSYPMAQCVHRTLSRNYRVTTRCVYRDNGFRQPADGQIELARVTHVCVTHTPLQRRLRVGCIVLEAEGKESLALDGVYDPEAVAALIRRWVERARRNS